MLSFQSLDAAKFDFSDDAWDKKVMKDYTIIKKDNIEYLQFNKLLDQLQQDKKIYIEYDKSELEKKKAERLSKEKSSIKVKKVFKILWIIF